MFQRFTDVARGVVVSAQEAARAQNLNYIGSEHLVIGLYETKGATGSILEEAAPREVIEAVYRERLGTGEFPFEGGHIPFTPNAKALLEKSLRVSVEWEHSHIASQELAAAFLTRMPDVQSFLDWRGISTQEPVDVVARLLASDLGDG